MTLYYSLIQPYLQYGIVLWGGAHNKYINRLKHMSYKLLFVIVYVYPEWYVLFENKYLLTIK